MPVLVQPLRPVSAQKNVFPTSSKSQFNQENVAREPEKSKISIQNEVDALQNEVFLRVWS
jgi:hypothetical protein